MHYYLNTSDLARQPGISGIEGDIDLFDAGNAEKMFLNSTSLPHQNAYITGVACYLVEPYLDQLGRRAVTRS